MRDVYDYSCLVATVNISSDVLVSISSTRTDTQCDANVERRRTTTVSAMKDYKE